MKFLRQILLIFLFSFLGELLRSLIPLPIPASIYGMVLLFAALSTGLVKVHWVKDAGSFLVSFFPVLFVAPIVSLLDCWDNIKEKLLPLLFIVIFSAVVCFLTAGRFTQWLITHKKEEKEHV